MKIVSCLLFVLILTGCEPSAQSVQAACAKQLKAHFSIIEKFESAESREEFRNMIKQMISLAQSAETEGCSSRVKYGVNEIYSVSNDFLKVSSDESVRAHSISGLYSAGTPKQLEEKLQSLVSRFTSAIDLLSEHGAM